MGKAERVNQELPEPEGTVENRLLSRIDEDTRLLPNLGSSALHVPAKTFKGHYSHPCTGVGGTATDFWEVQSHLPRTADVGDSSGTVPPFRRLDLALGCFSHRLQVIWAGKAAPSEENRVLIVFVTVRKEAYFPLPAPLPL